jgi:hypothetical protein
MVQQLIVVLMLLASVVFVLILGYVEVAWRIEGRRFSMRWLLVFTALIAVFMGLIVTIRLLLTL